MINSVGTAIRDMPLAIKFWIKELNVPVILVLSLPRFNTRFDEWATTTIILKRKDNAKIFVLLYLSIKLSFFGAPPGACVYGFIFSKLLSFTGI